MAARAVRCRYHDRLDNPCPNEAAVSDPDAGIQLCPRHLLEAHTLFVEMAKAKKIVTTLRNQGGTAA